LHHTGGAPTHVLKKTRGSFLLSNFINLFHEFIAFLSCHFVFLCYLIISSSLCYGDTRERVVCLVQIELVFGMKIHSQKVLFFSLRSMPISGLYGQFFMLGVCKE
jgi:hypothetical protein